MIHAAEVLERLARDVKIVTKNFSLSPTDNLRSILGDGADWKPEPGSLSEVAHFAELIAERRAALRVLGAREPRRYLASHQAHRSAAGTLSSTAFLQRKAVQHPAARPGSLSP